MKRLATTVVFLFLASLLGSAVTGSCMAAPRSSVGAEMQTPPCCAMQVACMGGACTSSAQHVGCTSQPSWSVVAQKDEIGGLVKIVPPLVVPIPSLTTIAHTKPPPLPVSARSLADVVGYDDVYARTGRLLI